MSTSEPQVISPHLYEQSWPNGEYRLFQLGFVVRDLIAAARKWVTVMGTGPFHVMPRVQGPCVYRGVETTADMRIAVTQSGPVQIELIQDFSEEPGVLSEHIRLGCSAGQAIHQLCTLTSNFAAKKRHFQRLGYDIACEMTDPRNRVAYVDTVQDFGFYTEIVEDKPSFRANLARIAETCASWDGVTDPIRFLTRDGYTTSETAGGSD